jgi:hypothetical protein
MNFQKQRTTTSLGFVRKDSSIHFVKPLYHPKFWSLLELSDICDGTALLLLVILKVLLVCVS